MREITVPVACAEDFAEKLEDFQIAYEIHGEDAVCTVANRDPHWVLRVLEHNYWPAQRTLTNMIFASAHGAEGRDMDNFRAGYPRDPQYAWRFKVECTATGMIRLYSGTFRQVADYAKRCRVGRRNAEVAIRLSPEELHIAQIDQTGAVKICGYPYVRLVTLTMLGIDVPQVDLSKYYLPGETQQECYRRLTRHCNFIVIGTETGRINHVT